MKTKSPVTYRLAREMCLDVLWHSFPSADCDLEAIYEWSSWIDGMVDDAVAEFHALCLEVSQDSLEGRIMLAKAWNKRFPSRLLPHKQISGVLLLALSRFESLSQSFGRLACQVAMKYLVYLAQPLPLAAFILDCSKGSGKEGRGSAPFERLSEYAECLVCFGEKKYQRYYGTLRLCLDNLFTPDSYPSALLPSDSSLDRGDFAAIARTDGLAGYFLNEDVDVKLRQLYHMCQVSDDDHLKGFVDQFRASATALLKVSGPPFSRLNRVRSTHGIVLSRWA